MPILVVTGFILILSLFILSLYQAARASKNRSRRPLARPFVTDLPLPKQLGLNSTYPMQDIVDRLEVSFATEFGDRLKVRFLQKHPSLKPEEFDWQLLELKRYFVLATVLREVPMFSTDVDEIWHEMLLFSREYDSFCRAFAGEVIHHAPHTEPAPNPKGRAWFDWVYCQLFEVTPYSLYAWRNFFRNPLDQQQLKEFQNQGLSQLLPTYFSENPAVRTTALQLIDTLRDQMKNTTRPASVQRNTSPDLHTGATSAFVFFSLYETDTFQEQMDRVVPDTPACGGTTISDDSSKNSSCNSSSCSSSSCSSSSCSSSSSCGSSCGSS